MSDSLWSNGLQHARFFCPSPTPGACSNSCPSSQWCHPTSSSSVIHFPSCLQPFLALGCSLRSQVFTSCGQSIGARLQHQSLHWIFRTDFLYNWLVGSSCNPRYSQESSPKPQLKSINSLALSFFMVQLSHPYMTTGKTIVLTKGTFVSKVMSLLICCLGLS